MGISPIYAIPKALSQAGLSKDDVDVYEVRSVLDISFGSLNDPCFGRSTKPLHLSTLIASTNWESR